MHWPPCTLSQWRSVLLLCAASNLDFLCEWERQKIRIERTQCLRRLMWSVNAQQLWTTVHCWTHEKQFIALKGCATNQLENWFVLEKGNSMFRAFTKSFSVISTWVFPKYHYESDWGFKDDNVDHANAAADMEFVKKFTPPEFQAKSFTPSLSANFNSFGD